MPADVFGYFDSFGHLPFIDYISPRSLHTSSLKGLACVLAVVFRAVFVLQWINAVLGTTGV